MIRWYAFALFMFLASGSESLAQDHNMRFEPYPPDPMYSRLMGAHAWVIYGSGVIDVDAPQRLEALVVAKKIPLGSYLYLHSPGGSVTGGMRLGRMIRKYRLATNIGRHAPDSSLGHSSIPGVCLSACAIAYLGGQFRFLISGSTFGVHRFFWDRKTEHDADIAQIVSSSLVEYIRSMDVDTGLFALASSAGRDQMATPSRQVLEKLNVVNNGRKKESWTIESIDLGLYLKGEQETSNGMNKFMILCPPNSSTMALYAIFDAGRNSEEVMSFDAISLLIDHKPILLSGNNRATKFNDKGYINVIFRLDAQLLNAISRAQTVGIALQPTSGAVFYAGFDGMSFTDGAAKLAGLVSLCTRRQK